MSAEQSIGAKSRWETCQLLAERLGCDKVKVHDKLYSKMRREGLIKGVLEGDEDDVEEVKGWPEWSDEPLRAFQPLPSSQKDPSPMDKGKAAAEKLKLALWFIEKMGGADKAKRAIDLATSIAEQLE